MPWYWWISNPLTNCLSSSVSAADKLVTDAEYELDIVKLVRKLKVVERSLKKKELLKIFQPKILDIKVVEKEGSRR